MILSFPQAIRATQKSTGSFNTTAGVANSDAQQTTGARAERVTVIRARQRGGHLPLLNELDVTGDAAKRRASIDTSRSRSTREPCHL
jgi:hypothetical protein